MENVTDTVYQEKGVRVCVIQLRKKIADCVRQLMKRKEISKITIGDIMEATGMSRQSFYYHFKDIYDVLEWIGCNDFKDQLQGQYDSMEKWACDLMEVLQRERSFYEKLANELAWPMIVRGVRMALDAQVRRLLLGENPGMFEKHPEELEAVTSFLSTSICYYMIDFVYYRKTLSGEQVKRDVQFMMRAIAKTDAGLAVLLPRTAVL